MVRARKLLKRGVRDRTHRFLVEGAIGIREALNSRVRIDSLFLEHPAERHLEELFDESSRPGLETFEVSSPVMKSLTAAVTPQGLVAVAQFVDRPIEEVLKVNPTMSVVLADVRDPGNVGTIIRTAWAVGADAIFLGSGSADLYNPKVVRASAGALFNVPICRDVAVAGLLDELGSSGMKRIAADPKGEVAYDKVDMTKACAFVFGNEAWGLGPELASKVDVAALIPMSGAAESVNVAISAAAFLFEAARQRRDK